LLRTRNRRKGRKGKAKLTPQDKKKKRGAGEANTLSAVDGRKLGWN